MDGFGRFLKELVVLTAFAVINEPDFVLEDGRAIRVGEKSAVRAACLFKTLFDSMSSDDAACHLFPLPVLCA